MLRAAEYGASAALVAMHSNLEPPSSSLQLFHMASHIAMHCMRLLLFEAMSRWWVLSLQTTSTCLCVAAATHAVSQHCSLLEYV
jgi:hypothetical protein